MVYIEKIERVYMHIHIPEFEFSFSDILFNRILFILRNKNGIK